MESCVFLYRRLERQKVLRGFNCLQDTYPDSSTSFITPMMIKERTGVTFSKTPTRSKKRLWQIGSCLGLCLTEYLIANQLGVDSLSTALIPATVLLFGADQRTHWSHFLQDSY